jgi:hypothetical protein
VADDQNHPTPRETALNELHSSALDLTEASCDVLAAILRDPKTHPELRADIALDFLERVAPKLGPVAFRQREQERRTRQLELDAREAEAEARADRAALDRERGLL